MCLSDQELYSPPCSSGASRRAMLSIVISLSHNIAGMKYAT